MSIEAAIEKLNKILDNTAWAKVDNLGLVNRNDLRAIKVELEKLKGL